MHFVLADTKAVWWPVTLRVPDPDRSGQFLEQQFEALIMPVDQDDYFDEQERIAALPQARARATAERESLGRHVRGWRGVRDGGDAEIPFSAAHLALALKRPWFRTGLLTAIGQINLGQEARLGN